MTKGSIQIPVVLDTATLEAALARIELLTHTLHGVLMTKVSEVEGLVVGVTEQLAKASGEILDAIAKLQGELADAELPAGAVAALADLAAKAQALDDIVPDAPPVV